MENLNLQSLAERNLTSYVDKNIALFSQLSEVRNLPQTDVFVEGYLMAFIIKGSAQVMIDEDTYTVHEGDIFVCSPRNILEKTMLSIDIEAKAIFVTPTSLEKIANMVNLSWSLRVMAQTHEIIHVEQSSLRRLIKYYDMIEGKLLGDETPNKTNCIDFLLCAFAYELFDIRMSIGKITPTQSFSSADYIFQRFTKLLEDKNRPFSKVKGYAEELNITPKYFSFICKQLTGKTAGRIIDDEVIKTAKILLRNNSLSIKQIADILNFANQSHFGTFFRKRVGMSPHNYRDSF